jgi:transcriptional regulator with XRE-family HTH domain
MYSHNNGVAKTISALLPPTSELLTRFGARLRLARLRRRLSAKQVAERAGMVPMTLRNVERGGAGVTMGAYLAVMQVLGMEKDLELLAAADPLGRELQDSRLRAPKRARDPQPATSKTPTESVGSSTSPLIKRAKTASHILTGGWVERDGFASSAALASLLGPVASPKKSRVAPRPRRQKKGR